MHSRKRVRFGKNLIPAVFSLLALSCSTAPVKAQESGGRPTPPPTGDGVSRDAYRLRSSHQKLVDNHGDGYDDLYGTRNFREVLAGVLYRGGANNRFSRYDPRDNRNPLPEQGLENLCKEGFSTAVYLYPVRFETAPHKVDCVDRRTGKPNSLEYLQISPYNETSIRELLTIVHRKIKNRAEGPAYYHCWNGWHASGLISAYSLRQFCGFSGEEAVKYWDLNTDGNDNEPAFKKIRDNIRAFSPYSDLQLSEAEKKELCLPMNVLASSRWP